MTLREELIRLGSVRKDLRPHIRPILRRTSSAEAQISKYFENWGDARSPEEGFAEFAGDFADDTLQQLQRGSQSQLVDDVMYALAQDRKGLAEGVTVSDVVEWLQYNKRDLIKALQKTASWYGRTSSAEAQISKYFENWGDARSPEEGFAEFAGDFADDTLQQLQRGSQSELVDDVMYALAQDRKGLAEGVTVSDVVEWLQYNKRDLIKALQKTTSSR